MKKLIPRKKIRWEATCSLLGFKLLEFQSGGKRESCCQALTKTVLGVSSTEVPQHTYHSSDSVSFGCRVVVEKGGRLTAAALFGLRRILCLSRKRTRQ